MAKTLAELAALVPDSYIIGDGSLEIASIQHDSRKVTQGTLFACMVGAHVDAHTFIPQAREKGAVAIITANEDADMPAGVAVLVVKNLSEALQTIVPYFYDYPARKMRVIGITGTNGKTTTAYLAYESLNAMHMKCAALFYSMPKSLVHCFCRRVTTN